MDIKKIAEYTLQKIRETGADMGRCSVKSGATTEIYYESGKISMIRTVFSGAVRIGIIDGQREGTAALNSFDTAEIDAAVAEAYEAVYDLQGRKIDNPTKGIYIVDSKKTLIK